jgi:hypothetical protein
MKICQKLQNKIHHLKVILLILESIEKRLSTVLEASS